MKRKMRKRGKMMALTLSAVVAVSAVMAGTYAWRSVSQKALNEAKGNLNPGGRLHDDFNGLNLSSAQTTDNENTERKVKYVYVENFTDAQKQTNVYARIRLDEYLETGTGAGKPSNDATKSAQPLVAGTIIDDKTTWTPYKWDNDQTFRKYVTLSTGGDTVYMPTFNKDQDSLEADINGTLAGLDKNIETDTDDYSDYVKYTYDVANSVNTSKVADIEVYDAEGDGLDKVKEAGLDVETIVEAVKDPSNGKFNVTPNASSITIDGRSYTITKMEPDTISTSDDITAIYVDLDQATTGVTPQVDIILKTAEHTAQMTLDTDPSLDAASTPGILSMADWDALSMNDKVGKYWVYDSEGWLYWAEPIEPSTATGCLLNSIAINDTTQEGQNLQSTEYYYGLNVVAQFASAGDWGDAPNETGFYKDGLTPEGKNLLDTISAMDNPETAYQVNISMQDAAQSVAPGSSVQLKVKVENVVFGTEVTTDPTQVHWAIEQSSRNSRAVTVTPTNVDANGLLSVAENETAQTLTVVATYNYDPYNAEKTVEGRFSINVTGALTYPITIGPQALTEITKGDSDTFTAQISKKIADALPEATSDGTLTWSVTDAATGNALSSNTSIDPTTGVLTVDPAETAAALKVTATYTVEYVDSTGASLGTKQWTAEKTITVKNCQYEMAQITAVGNAEPGTTIRYSTNVQKTNGSTQLGNTINSGSGSGITWTLTGGTPSDPATTLDPQTGTLTIGSNETNGNLTVKASYRDPLNPNADGSANVEKTTPVGTIRTTAYTVTVNPANTTVTQGNSVNLTATVKPANGTASVNAAAIANPVVEWQITTNVSDTNTKLGTATATSTGSSVTLTVGANETQPLLNLTATYKKGGTAQPTAGNATVTVTPYTYQLSLNTTNITSLKQRATQDFTATVKKMVNGNAVETKTITAAELTWNVTAVSGTKKNDTSMTKPSANVGCLTVGKYETNPLKVSVSYQNAGDGKTSNTATATVGAITAAEYTMANISLVSGSAQPNTNMSLKTSVTRMDATTETIITGITWSLSGNQTDSDTKVTAGANGTATLHIGTNETATDLKVTATYTDSNAGRTVTKTYNVGEIQTTGYAVEVSKDYTPDLVQGDTVTFTAKVRRTNGTQKNTYVENPAISWSLTGNTGTTILSDATSAVNTDVKKTLTIGANETGTVKLTASYSGATTVAYNKAILKLEYTVTLTGGSTSIVQEETGNAYTAKVTKKNGRNARTQLATTLSASNLTWSIATPANTATAMTGNTYGSGTASAKLKIAETESATSVTVKAVYKDTVNNVSYESTGSNVNITKSAYAITAFSVAETQIAWGGSTAVSITVRKTNGTPKTVSTTAKDTKLLWSYSGRSSALTKINSTTGNLQIASMETAKSMTLKPTYKAANGATATTDAITISYMGTPEQVAVNKANLGEKVTIGDVEYWKIYTGKKSGTNKDVVLMWQAEPEADYKGRNFGTSCQWGSSTARSYLENTYLTNHSKINEMVTNEVIPRVTNYQRTDPSNSSSIVSSADTVFLLSEADLWGVIYSTSLENDTPDEKEYTTYGVTGTGIRLLSDLPNKTTIMSHTDTDSIVWTWLRSSRCDTNDVAKLEYNGTQPGDSYGYTYTTGGLRPAFWIYL